MNRTGFPGDALNIVLTVGDRDGQRVVARAGGNPDTIGGHCHRFTVASVGRLLVGRHAPRIEHHTPIAGFAVHLLEGRTVLDRDGERRVRDGNCIIIAVRSSRKTGDRKRNGSEQAQAHQEAHQATTPRKPARGKGRSSPCVLHTVLLIVT